MAEVGQRLGSGVYRLSALRHSQARPVCPGESPGSLLATCSFSDSRTKDDSTKGQREVQLVKKHRATQHRSAKLSRVGASESQQGSVSVCLELEPFNFPHSRESLCKTALFLSERLQPLLQEKLLPGRMTPWTRGAVSIHPDAFRSPQQLRAFCTVIFILAEQRQRRLKLHPQASTASRGYSRRSDSSSKDAPLLQRSRTAYYDILRVSPGATQSQIKTAYYKQSFIYHPDKNPGNEQATERFSEISEAYTVLGNISLRRKYDRGILSRSDVQSAGRPSSKETVSRSTGPSQQQQQRARRSSQAGGRTMYDFDAFYQAHYGEQLQRERELRARKQRMEEMQREKMDKWKEGKVVEFTVAMMLTMAGLIFLNLSKS